MSHTAESLYTEQLPIADTIRLQLTPENGVATTEIVDEPVQFNVLDAHSLAEHADMNPEASVTQDLIAVADTGKTMFSVVRASVVDRNGNASTRLFLTEIPHADEQSGKLIHEFKNNPNNLRTHRHTDWFGNAEDRLDITQYNGIQPLDADGRESRIQMMLDQEGLLFIRTDPRMPAADEHIERRAAYLSYGFGHALDTPPSDWIVPMEYVSPARAESYHTQQYAA